MTPKADSRRRSPDGEVVLVRVRDPKLLLRLRESVKVEGRGGKPRARSQREFAREVEISSGHYSDIENGLKNPSYEVAKRIADSHSTTVPALFEEIPLDFGPAEPEAASA